MPNTTKKSKRAAAAKTVVETPKPPAEQVAPAAKSRDWMPFIGLGVFLLGLLIIIGLAVGLGYLKLPPSPLNPSNSQGQTSAQTMYSRDLTVNGPVKATRYGSSASGVIVYDKPCGQTVGPLVNWNTTGNLLEGPIPNSNCALPLSSAARWYKVKWSNNQEGWSTSDSLSNPEEFTKGGLLDPAKYPRPWAVSYTNQFVKGQTDFVILDQNNTPILPRFQASIQQNKDQILYPIIQNNKLYVPYEQQIGVVDLATNILQWVKIPFAYANFRVSQDVMYLTEYTDECNYNFAYQELKPVSNCQLWQYDYRNGGKTLVFNRIERAIYNILSPEFLAANKDHFWLQTKFGDSCVGVKHVYKYDWSRKFVEGYGIAYSCGEHKVYQLKSDQGSFQEGNVTPLFNAFDCEEVVIANRPANQPGCDQDADAKASNLFTQKVGFELRAIPDEYDRFDNCGNFQVKSDPQTVTTGLFYKNSNLLSQDDNLTGAYCVE
jgi:hypothetical protein